MRAFISDYGVVIGLVVVFALSIIANWLTFRRIKARGHWNVTIHGDGTQTSEWVPPKRPRGERDL